MNPDPCEPAENVISAENFIETPFSKSINFNSDNEPNVPIINLPIENKMFRQLTTGTYKTQENAEINERKQTQQVADPDQSRNKSNLNYYEYSSKKEDEMYLFPEMGSSFDTTMKIKPPESFVPKFQNKISDLNQIYFYEERPFSGNIMEHRFHDKITELRQSIESMESDPSMSSFVMIEGQN